MARTYVASTGLGAVLAPVAVAVFGIEGALVAVGACLPLLAALSWTRLARFEATTPIPERQFALLRSCSLCRTAPHRHNEDAVERFTLIEGAATGTVAGEQRHLRPGDVMEIPRGAAHVHPHTGRNATAVIEHVIEPRVRFVEVYFPTWLAWLAEGHVDRQDEPTLAGVMAVLQAADGDTWVAGLPIGLQRSAARVGARLAAMRGLHAIS